jgi:membrane glycosyltransferase
VSVYTSRVSLGRRLRRKGLFLIPEELQPPTEIRAAIMNIDRDAPTPSFVDAVVDPALNALICATGWPRARVSRSLGEERRHLVHMALSRGPDALADAQKMRLIDDPDALAELHAAVWTSADVHPSWRKALGVNPPSREGQGGEVPLALGVA